MNPNYNNEKWVLNLVICCTITPIHILLKYSYRLIGGRAPPIRRLFYQNFGPFQS